MIKKMPAYMIKCDKCKALKYCCRGFSSVKFKMKQPDIYSSQEKKMVENSCSLFLHVPNRYLFVLTLQILK